MTCNQIPVNGGAATGFSDFIDLFLLKGLRSTWSSNIIYIYIYIYIYTHRPMYKKRNIFSNVISIICFTINQYMNHWDWFRNVKIIVLLVQKRFGIFFFYYDYLHFFTGQSWPLQYEEPKIISNIISTTTVITNTCTITNPTTSPTCTTLFSCRLQYKITMRHSTNVIK